MSRLVALLLFVPAFTSQVPGGVARAQDAVTQDAPADVAALEAALDIPALFAVIAQEGADYGAGLDTGMFAGKGGLRWQAVVARIYDPARLQPRFSSTLSAALADQPQVIADAVAFFTSDTGKRIVAREIAARQALLDPDVTEAAEVAAEKARDARAPRLKQVRALIEAGDLIESNVASALTGSAAFNEAVSATQPPSQRLPEIDRMAQVWREEGEIRASTTAWLVTFMLLAYEPLSDQDLDAFVRFSQSDSGKAFNRALFTAYSETFRVVMAELGHEAGRMLLGARI